MSITPTRSRVQERAQPARGPERSKVRQRDTSIEIQGSLFKCKLSQDSSTGMYGPAILWTSDVTRDVRLSAWAGSTTSISHLKRWANGEKQRKKISSVWPQEEVCIQAPSMRFRFT